MNGSGRRATGAGVMPGARFAMRIVHPASPGLRVRYRQGVLVTPHGFPDWLLYARAMVEVPAPPPDLTRDETRVVDVLAANARMHAQGDPLWPPAGEPYRTPAGWCWAHLGMTRQLALVPIELHGSYRHAGGVRTMPVARQERGLRADRAPAPVGRRAEDVVPDGILDDVQRLVGYDLPPTYRRFLRDTNGATPAEPGVLRAFGFIADQPFFGLDRPDRYQDLLYAGEVFRDRLTRDFLAIGQVQGGLLAVKVAGGDAGSIWYLDDDDPADDDAFTAEDIGRQLLRRCADTIDDFWSKLHRPAAELIGRVTELVESGRVVELRPEFAGAGLPAARRAPWQPPPHRGADPLVADFELR